MAFDLFDTNNDDKISELDLYKIFSNFEKMNRSLFETVMHQDICTMMKLMSFLHEDKFKELMEAVSYDNLAFERQQSFR